MPENEVVLITCGGCEKEFEEDELVSVIGSDNKYCDDCESDVSFYCDRCDERFANNHYSRFCVEQPEVTYCSGCYLAMGCFECASCDIVMTEEYYGQDGNCQGCVPDEEDEEEDEENVPINNHSFDSTRKLAFMGGPEKPLPGHKPTLFMGVELEMEVEKVDRNDVAKAFVEAVGSDFVLLKEDGSISYGFEAVSAPATLDVQRQRWKALFDKRREKDSILKSLKSFNTTTCGMHIHLSRNATTPLQVGKMLAFLNEPKNKDFVVAVAGRESVQWCKMLKKKVTDAYDVRRDTQYPPIPACPACGATTDFEDGGGVWICSNQGCCEYDLVDEVKGPDGLPLGVLKNNGTHPNSRDRYTALNLSNQNTIEMRIFKGTLKETSFLKNIEFAHALAMFSADVGLGYDKVTQSFSGISHIEFCKWLDNRRRGLYPNLALFLESKGFVPKRKKKIDATKAPKPISPVYGDN